MSSDLEKAKLKRLYKDLSSYQGSGTSMVTLIIRAGEQISRINSMLTEEMGTASNIKSRVNRLSVVSAITSAQQKLKLYSKTPPNGLCIFCGIADIGDEKPPGSSTGGGKVKKLSISFEPFRPINYTLYKCDKKFHLEPLTELFKDDKVIGFIVIDGNGYLVATVQGSSRTILSKKTVSLPSKSGRGGQSKLRFERIVKEKRHNYITLSAEAINNLLLVEEVPIVSMLFIAGCGPLKNKLIESKSLDSRLQSIVKQVVDVAHGHESGLNQAIDIIAPTLPEFRFTEEKKILEQFFTSIQKSDNLSLYGLSHIQQAIGMGAVSKLIVCEDVITDSESKIMNLMENKDAYEINMVSSSTSLGAQFMNGFGGIGAMLRYQLPESAFESLEEHPDSVEDDKPTNAVSDDFI